MDTLFWHYPNQMKINIPTISLRKLKKKGGYFKGQVSISLHEWILHFSSLHSIRGKKNFINQKGILNRAEDT